MTTPPTREGIVVVLDASPALSADSFRMAKSACENLIQQKLIFAPRDEVGLVVSGVQTTHNRLHTAAPTRFHHLTVARPIAPPTMDIVRAIDAVTQPAAAAAAPGGGGGKTDILEALLVAADLIVEQLGTRRYTRRIFLVTEAAEPVQNKHELANVIALLKKQEIQLVVIGVDFEDDAVRAAAGNDNWEALSVKQQNERVLAYLCQELGNGSLLVPVNDALEALTALRKRSITQRAVARCVLQIADVEIAVHLYTKTLAATIPSLKKATAKGPVVMDRRYTSATEPDKELDPTRRIKAYRYGKSIVPFAEVDEAQMKFQSERSLMALGFVPMTDVPHHLLMGGVKVVAPAPEDSNGATALSAFVRGMDELQRAMLVRYVRHTNATPALCVCFPMPKAERKDAFLMAPLPFAEDLRFFQFSACRDVVVPIEQAKAVNDLVNSMTLDSDTLKPSRTFNAALQYQYQCVKYRLLHPEDPKLPPVSETIVKSSCLFGAPTSVLDATNRASQPARKRCRELFSYHDVHEKASSGSGADKAFWFVKGATAAPLGVAVKHETESSASLTPGAHTPHHQSLRDAVDITVAASTLHVTTMDPVGTFKAILRSSSGDHVDRAIFEMTEVILKLLATSIGTQYHDRCWSCIEALRHTCVQEDEGVAFNKFLVNLIASSGDARGEGFWKSYCVARRLRPITRLECDNSDLADDAAADAFLSYDRRPVLPVVAEVEDEDLFGQLE